MCGPDAQNVPLSRERVRLAVVECRSSPLRLAIANLVGEDHTTARCQLGQIDPPLAIASAADGVWPRVGCQLRFPTAAGRVLDPGRPPQGVRAGWSRHNHRETMVPSGATDLGQYRNTATDPVSFIQ